jgi:hypothetical protein
MISKGFDDARNDPNAAVSLLLWSELRTVRWQEGWREFFVHCAGMHNRLETVPEMRFITPITKALLERASLEGEVRLHSVEDRFIDFNFGDMWPAMSPSPPPERASFDRLRHFLKGYYEASCGTWPVPPPPGSEQWLTRDLTKRLQKDFGALYDYLVNREVVWDGSEGRSSRKWNIVNTNGDTSLNVDTPDLPLTDILVAFDNRLHYPHIPHPYPLVPESIPVVKNEKYLSSDHPTRGSKKSKAQPPPPPPRTDSEDKLADRRIALAYTEATNIYLLGSDFVHNKLVDAFVRFEKSDRPGDVDPFAARRGRWVLIYGILQVLASISVDTPGMRYHEGVPYHLNPRLRGTPPWKTQSGAGGMDEASHEGSHCWLVPKVWAAGENEIPMLDSFSITTTSPMVPSPRRLAVFPTHSVRSSAAPSVAGTESDAGSERFPASRAGSSRRGGPGSERSWNSRRAQKQQRELDHLSLGSGITGQGGIPGFSPNSGFSTVLKEHNERQRERETGGYGGSPITPTIGTNYGPGIQKLDEWPIREESMGISGINGGLRRDRLIIKDFDEYEF